MKMISYISICTLSDLGVLSDLIGSLSRTTLQYSTPSECRNAQARCFVEFLNKNFSRLGEVLELMFLMVRKQRFFICFSKIFLTIE